MRVTILNTLFPNNIFNDTELTENAFIILYIVSKAKEKNSIKEEIFTALLQFERNRPINFLVLRSINFYRKSNVNATLKSLSHFIPFLCVKLSQRYF